MEFESYYGWRVESNSEDSTKGLLRQQGCHQYFT